MLSFISNFFPVRNFTILWLFFSLTITLLNSCAPQAPKPSPGHLSNKDISPAPKTDIPEPVQQLPFVPPPEPQPPLETYTVVVDNVPIDKLLFALARDAGLNVDIHPGIRGTVTLNAINQTLPQLLERIAKQVDLRYQIEDDYLTISPDLPYRRLYKVGYVNMSRKSTSELEVSTQLISELDTNASGGSSSRSGGRNNDSTTRIVNESNNRFWESLTANITAILASDLTQEGQTAEENLKNNVIVNAESGIISVRATAKQHQAIQRFLDQVITNAQRQVLIEATIAEVKLSDRYQAGIDWSRIDGDFSYIQALTSANLGNQPFYSFEYNNTHSQFGNLSATVRLLEQFGTVKVLSSPKIMALNNQTAVLKVVENTVYFTTEVNITSQADVGFLETFSTIVNTVPVGLIMSITPQISDNEVVTLNIRPTISRIVDFKNDPNPVLAQAGVTSPIPEIQVREMESVLKINNGDVAIIGGLMQDTVNKTQNSVPVLSKIPLLGDLFTYRDELYEKTELVIFLRPVVIKEASLKGDLQDYQIFLPQDKPEPQAPTGFIQP